SLSYCGVEDDVFEREYMMVEPGLFTLRFEETQFHRNSPFRVSLHDVDSDDFCLLLDHIPHNNDILISDTCSRNANGYPLGSCASSTYYITVKIPDIECNRCNLRLAFSRLDLPDSDVSCDLNNGTCEGYVSCANIRIRPSAEGLEQNISACVRYEDNLAGNWPNRPKDYYSVELVEGQKVMVEPLVMFDPLHQQLHIDIPRHGFSQEIEEVQVVLNNSVVWSKTVTADNKLTDTIVVIWTIEDYDTLVHLENHSAGDYRRATESEYTSSGWLSDYRFRGKNAEDLDVIMPSGPCAPTPRYFIAFLHPSEGSRFMHGVLAASFLDDYADITVVLYGLDTEVTSITIVGSQLLGAPDVNLPVSLLKSNVLRISVDVSKQMPYIDTVQFLKTVMVKTRDPRVGLSGNFEEGIFAILRDGIEVKGIAGFQFTQGQWLKYEVLVTGLTSDADSVEMTSREVLFYNLTTSVHHLSQQNCLVEGLIKDLTSDFVLRLWQGEMQLVIRTNSSVLQGKLTQPGAVYCREAREAACFVVDMTPGGQPVPQGAEKIPPSGKAAFLLDRAGGLQYSVEIDNVRDQRNTLEVEVRNGDDLIFPHKLTPAPDQWTVYTVTSRMEVSESLSDQLAAGQMSIRSFPSSARADGKGLVGFLPPIKRHLCVQPVTHVVGEGRGLWSPDAAPLPHISAIVGDTLIFQYSGNVTLYSMPSNEDMLTCNFDNATLEGPVSINGSEVIFSKPLNTSAKLYFTSEAHCNESNDTTPLQLAVTVRVAAPPPAVDTTTDFCGSLVFSRLRQKRLDAYSGPQPTGPAVAGLVLGSVIALGFFIWDRRLRQKADSAVPGNRFQRF
ncbi:hypothetical protein BaRGS_00029260, partial [Batillaria attramentaria]